MIHLSLAEYEITLSEKLSEQKGLQRILAENNYSSVFILTDENTHQYCLPFINNLMHEQAYTVLKIHSGESEKNIETCKFLWQQLIENHAGRKSVLINLGGGVIGDMGGFVASTFKRGFDFINLPTTLLSQVDASVGGKLGIDFMDMKNLIGVFQNPTAIFIATEFLQTLPFEQLRSGFAEILKHGLISNRDYWGKIKLIDLHTHTDWLQIIAESVSIKQQVVESDMLETGLRKILNFGHTIGHAVETLSLRNDHTPLLHGEAIAIGMICEAYLSHRANGLSENALNEITATIQKNYPPYQINQLSESALFSVMAQDKKNQSKQISFSLLSEIGACEFDKFVSDELIIQSLHYYQSLS